MLFLDCWLYICTYALIASDSMSFQINAKVWILDVISHAMICMQEVDLLTAKVTNIIKTFGGFVSINSAVKLSE